MVAGRTTMNNDEANLIAFRSRISGVQRRGRGRKQLRWINFLQEGRRNCIRNRLTSEIFWAVCTMTGMFNDSERTKVLGISFSISTRVCKHYSVTRSKEDKRSFLVERVSNLVIIFFGGRGSKRPNKRAKVDNLLLMFFKGERRRSRRRKAVWRV
ncbi:hypothetical protein QOT17_25624 [Balamuthia mandrillaris]